jgi:hypothetical protein
VSHWQEKRYRKPNQHVSGRARRKRSVENAPAAPSRRVGSDDNAALINHDRLAEAEFANAAGTLSIAA